MNKRFFNQQNLTRRLRLLSVLFAMLLLPLGAWAEDYPITVAGIQVTSDNATDIVGDGITEGTVTFTPASGDNPATLTLNGATITGSIVKTANEAGDQLTINLVGINTVNGQILFQSEDRMYPGDLTFTGSGSLNIASNDENGVIDGVSSVNTGEGLYIATDSPAPHCFNGYYVNSTSAEDNSVKSLTISSSETYPIWVYNSSSSTKYTQLTAASSTFTTANVDDDHSGSVSFNGTTLTLNSFNCKTANGDYVFYIGESKKELTINLEGTSCIFGNCFHYLTGNNTLTFITSESTPGCLEFTTSLSFWGDVTFVYSSGLGYYSNKISTDWPRLQIGGTFVRGTTYTVEGYNNVSFDDATNTLTLNGVTIGTQNSTVTDIDVFIKNLNVEISGTNTVYGRFFGFYEENGSKAGTITFKKKSGAETAELTVSGIGDGNGPVTNFASSILGEGLYVSGIDDDNEPVSTLSYQGGEYCDFDNPDNTVKEVTISENEPDTKLWIGETEVTSANAEDVFGDGKVSYDATNHTLSLNGATIEEEIVSNVGTLTIDLTGSNSVKYISATGNATALAFTGTSTATLNLSNSDGVISGFSSVNTGDFNLLSNSTPGIHWNATSKQFMDFANMDIAPELTLTKSKVYPLWIGNIQVTGNNETSITGEGITKCNDGAGSITFDPDNNLLTFDGVSLYVTNNRYIVSGLEDLSIKIKGNNYFNSDPYLTSDALVSTIEGASLTFSAEGDDPRLEMLVSRDPFSSFTVNYDKTYSYINTGGGYTDIYALKAPTVSLVDNVPTINSAGINDNGENINYYYTIDCEGTEYDVAETLIENGSTTLELSKPCIVTAYAKYTFGNQKTTQSSVNTGVHFGFKENLEAGYQPNGTINAPSIVPSLPESAEVTYTDSDDEQTNTINSGTGVISIHGVATESYTATTEFADGGYEDENENWVVVLNSEDPEDYGTYSLGTFSLTVTPKSLSNNMIQAIADQTYAGTALTPAIVVKDGETTLTQAENAEAEGDFTVAFSNNTNAALSTAETAPTVTITGKGNYTGTATKTFTIAAKDLASATVTVDPNQTYTYTGSAITPNVSSVSIKLTEGADAATNLTSDDYTVTGYANNTDAALATAETNAPTVTITGKGNFTGTATGTFTIAQAKLSVVTIAAIGNQTFTGSQITPGVTVTFNEKTVSTDEYNVVYGDNINAGENAGTVTLTSKNKNFVTSTDEDATTKKTATFNIVAAAAAITATEQTVTFNGGAQEFTNYTFANGEAAVTYYSSEEARAAQSGGTTSAPTNADTYYVQVTQVNNNYTSDPADATFTISPMTLTSEMVILSETNFEYTGGVRKPEVTVEVEENVELDPDDDYTVSYQKVVGETATAIENPIDVGDYNVVVTGKGNYTGTVTKQFSIGKTPATVTAPVATNPTYTGSAQNLVTAGATESGTVVYSLSADGAFTETIPQATDAGSYTVYYKATGDDNHSESAVGNVAATIAQANLGDVTIAEIGNQTYTGSQIKPEVTVTFGGKAVSEDEYTISYGTNINVGEGTVTLTSKDKNFSTTSTKGATFTIVAKTLTDAMVADIAAQTYSGTELKPALTVKDGETTLEEDTHYEVTYSNNKNAGTTAKATITGKGNYSGSIDKFFTINKAQLTVTPDDVIVNVGETITLTLSYDGFVDGDNEDVLTTEPTASYGTVDITKPGSYTITVNGGEAANYDFDYKTGTLTINRLLDVSFSASNEWVTYYASENLATPEGLKAYIVTGVGTSAVTSSPIDYIPANTAILLKNVSGNVSWSGISASAYTGATSTFASNKLIGTAEDVSVSSITGGTVYILINNMFRRATGTIPARRGYLVVTSSGNAPQLSITIDDETTVIGRVGCDSVATDGDEWFTLDGRKLQQKPTKDGLYIKNGKKVVINKK